MPSFSMTPARITEPAVGASVWASGSQVWTREQRHLHRERDGEARNSQRAVVVAIASWSSAIVDQVEGESVAGRPGVQRPRSRRARPA